MLKSTFPSKIFSCLNESVCQLMNHVGELLQSLLHFQFLMVISLKTEPLSSGAFKWPVPDTIKPPKSQFELFRCKYMHWMSWPLLPRYSPALPVPPQLTFYSIVAFSNCRYFVLRIFQPKKHRTGTKCKWGENLVSWVSEPWATQATMEEAHLD